MRVLIGTLCLALGFLCTLAGATEVLPVGQGGLRTRISAGDQPVPTAPFRTPAMMARAAPTNQWYSSLMFTRWSDVIHAVPLSVKASPKGLEVGFPHQTLVPTERRDVEVVYPHRPDLTLRPSAFEPQAAWLAGFSDWAVDMSFEASGQSMLTTVAHGSPYVYARLTQGDLWLDLAQGLSATPWGRDARVLLIRSADKTYAAFAPTGGVWQSQGQAWQLRLPEGRRYASVAVLPDAQDSTVAQFLAHAHAHIVETRADFRVDRAQGVVRTHFQVKTRAMEGEDGRTLMGLYPHHWHQNPTLAAQPLGQLPSIRGPIRLYAGAGFETVHPLPGFVPYWPGLQDPAAAKALTAQLGKDAGRARRMMLEIGQGPYWQGKGLQRISQLMSVADVQGDAKTRDQLLGLLKGRFEEWLSGQSSRTYFHYSPTLGTVVSYPEEYDAVKDMNDHHFHYGYWIRAAADIGLRDPKWIREDQWGGMINRLVADIATAERGRKDFPYLRNFDPYEGHSWASGVAPSQDGNNQESSSEAINAWAGLMVWGALQGRSDWVDLGSYLYATEIQAVQHYWFDLHGLTLPKEYGHRIVSMLFGGKLAHNTWWIDEPRQIHGINLLPLTSSSTYLAQSPAHVRESLAEMDGETRVYESRGKRAKPDDIWQDLFAKYLALVDPAAGRARWNEWGSVELGDTRTHAQHWLAFLQEHGPAELGVHANTPFYAVFQKESQTRSYLVFNAEAQPMVVRFSDGFELEAAPGRLTLKKVSFTQKQG